MRPLNPLGVPLQGRKLIEASAGTGKTYTLALLYLRQLLESKLSVDEILVVTFTRAATEELRHRIRQRIREALDVTEQRQNPDSTLGAILAGLDVVECRQVLTDALVRMDEAAIYTIHGFCQRVLQDYAFESGAPFKMEFLESETNLRNQIIEDFWRKQFFPVSAAEAAWVTATWRDPAGLLKVLTGPLSALEVDVIPVTTPEDSRQLRRRSETLLKEVQHTWPQICAPITKILEQDPCLKRNEKAYRKKDRVPALLASIKDLCNQTDFPFLLDQQLQLLTASEMERQVLKKCDTAPQHPFFQLFDDFFTSHKEFITTYRVALLQQASHFLKTEVTRRKEKQSRLFFDDLLINLDQALNHPRTGKILASEIRKRFPAALVDEFQDTDPLQYRIFSQVYHKDSTSLFMIGDPKQAIYSFRGADIFTYIKARRDTAASDCFTMDTNYRSTPAMVEAVNRLFNDPASFIFKDDIPFYPVQAQTAETKESMLINNQQITPLNSLFLPAEKLGARGKAPLNKEKATQAAAQFCAREIEALLAGGIKKQVTIGTNSITAGDIAVLVRTHREAAIMQQELARLDLASVYYSQESVFATNEADQFHQLLTCLTNLGDSTGINTCLISDFFGYSGSTLHHLHQDEQQWEDVITTLQKYRRKWQEQGIIPLFHLLLQEQQVVKRLSSHTEGNRKLTNYLHLAELLQEATGQQGTVDILHWLQTQRHQPEKDSASQQLRLEDDENLIRIITIHKAKGLEYPVVFLPFLWATRKPPTDEPLVFHNRTTFRMTVDLTPDNELHQQQAQEERLAEDLRLLYVAVTRAKHCCYFCWGRISRMEHSALAYLIHDQGNQSPTVKTEEEILTDLEHLNSQDRILTVKQHPLSFIHEPVAFQIPSQPLAAKRFHGRINDNWRITSYSQLVTDHASTTEVHEVRQEAPEEKTGNNLASAFNFPRGAEAGTCLHNILEELHFNQPIASQQELIGEQLRRSAFDAKLVETVCSWLEAVVNTELGNGCNLSMLPQQDQLREPAFLFPLDTLDLQQFNQVLQTWRIPPLPAAEGQLQGLIKGFIDLVFRFKGRYYLADYKSNHLGNGPKNYCEEDLEAAILAHRYDLQYLIYTVALHRYLESRCKKYDYATDFGGVFYLFIRAMDPNYPSGTGIFSTCPPYQLIMELDACCGNREARK